MSTHPFKRFDQIIKDLLENDTDIILSSQSHNPETQQELSKEVGVFKSNNGILTYESPITYYYNNLDSNLTAKDVKRGDILEVFQEFDSPIGIIKRGTKVVCLGSQSFPLVDVVSVYLLEHDIYRTTRNTKLFVKTNELSISEEDIQRLPWIRGLLTDSDKELLTDIMQKMDTSWRERWCSPGDNGCACVGAANCSGHLQDLGFTKEHWSAWMKENQS